MSFDLRPLHPDQVAEVMQRLGKALLLGGSIEASGGVTPRVGPVVKGSRRLLLFDPGLTTV
ncbi:MAG: hypothetical protein ACYCW6_26640 [Candidatus Xenobia bacterium]